MCVCFFLIVKSHRGTDHVLKPLCYFIRFPFLLCLIMKLNDKKVHFVINLLSFKKGSVCYMLNNVIMVSKLVLCM